MAQDDGAARRIGSKDGGEQFLHATKYDRATNIARLKSNVAWSDLCEAIKRSGEHMLAMDIDWHETDFVDVFQFLAGIVNGGIRTALDHADPAVPMWVPNGLGIKHSGDNADNLYLIAELDPSKTYCLSGLRGNCHDLLLEVSQGYMQQGAAQVYVSRSFNESFVADPDGNFEIIVGGDPCDGNWMALHPDGRQLLIRCYFLDWEKEQPPVISIAQIGHEGLPPAAIDAARMAEMLDDAAAWIESNALFWPRWTETFQNQRKAGEFNQAQAYVGGNTSILYGNNAYAIESGEVLLLEFTVPDARYWSFQLQNNAMVSMDYAHHQTSLNCRQIKVNDDGRVRIVLAHEDPGIANWLDVCGRPTGLLIWRWVWTRDNPEVKARKLKAAELDAFLPADTVRVSPEDRRATIAIRQRHIALRHRSC